MTIYEDLNQLLDDQLKRSARFVPMAVHVHSPGSFDWADEPTADKGLNDEQDLLKDAGVARYLDEAAKHLDIISITDHMKSGYACRASKKAKTRDDITVFPGIEINVTGGQVLGDSCIHVLAMFPPDCDTEAIGRIFGDHRGSRFPTDAERTGRETYSPPDLKTLAEAIHAQGGLFVLAHVDEPKRGHRARFRATREATLGCEWVRSRSTAPTEIQAQVSAEYLAYVAEMQPDAIEISNPEDREHYVLIPRNGGTRDIPCLIRSDHHCLEDFARDTAVTWIKVSRLDFKCVQDALRFFPTRVRFKDDLPATPSPRIIGVRLQSPGGEGLFEDALIGFNPNLNCIIGPRGSGKSTVIEALRYVLGRTPDLSSGESSLGASVNFSDVALGIQRANLKGTLIELIYETAEGTRNYLSATYDQEEPATTTVLTLDGSPRPLTSDAIQADFPIRIYSWSEIESLGRQPELQRTLLDRLIGNLPQLLEARNHLSQALEENRAAIDTASRTLENLLLADNGLLRRYTDLKTQFDQVNTEDVATLFRDLDQARDRVALLETVRDEIEDLRNTVDAIETDPLKAASETLAERTEEIREWWPSIAEALKLELFAGDVRKLLDAAVERATAKLEEVDSQLESARARVIQLEDELRPKTQSDPRDTVVRDQREERRQRYEKAAQQRQVYLNAYTAFQNILVDRKHLVEKLEATQTQISELRNESRQSLLAKLSPDQTGLDIGIRLDPLADRNAAIEYMRDSGFLTMPPFGHYKERKFAERTCSMARPTRISRAILDQDVALLEQDARLEAPDCLTREEASVLVNHFYPFGQDEHADVPVVARESLLAVLSLEEQPIDDEMRILLDGRPVDKRSPGQRSSAMLPLVALAETAPLIIDQPEDNLDNQMVGETLTKILADLKERRQIIVTTHNPNIVVGGDAEQVVVLNATDGPHAAIVEWTGSIDDDQIIEHVISIIEGGWEAFEARNRRYRPAHEATSAREATPA
jgi:DNA repair ATPase RecN